MNSQLIRAIVLTTVFYAALAVNAAVKLPALIGNNMVLQQSATINVWGWADAGENVSINAGWLPSAVSVKANSTGNWATTIPTPEAGGPYQIMIKGRDYTITIENVMIGEVWLCSGQSNMEFTMRGLGGWKQYKPEIREEVAKGTYSIVRLFTVKRDTSAIPLADCKGNWLIADTGTVNDFSATAWFFGSYLSKQLGVPVGLISAAWGGTPAEVWTPVESIKAVPDLGYYLNHWNGSPWWPGNPGVLYNAMIHPLANYTIKGAIWYQGESNRLDAKLYPQLIQTMITSWRKAWGIGDFPFYYTQIAPYAYDEPNAGALLREAQLKCLRMANTGMAVTLDLADNIADIHPKNKLDVGKRLALWALNKTYNKTDVAYSGPLYQDKKITGSSLTLGFSNTDGGLTLKEKAKSNFSIAGADRFFYPAEVKIEGNTLVLSSTKVRRPEAARYAFTNTSEASFFNGAGLPAPSFRTDNWDIFTDNPDLSPLFDPATKTLSYELSTHARETDIFYEFNNPVTKKSARYLSPIPAGKSGTLYATISRDGYLSDVSRQWKIVSNKASGAAITYKTPYSRSYSAGGDHALVDGIRATENFKDGNWQGFESNNLDVVIDLGETTSVKSISCNFLSNSNDWIFLPGQITVVVSDDGITYRNIGEISLDSDGKRMEPQVVPAKFKVKDHFRFINVKAINLGSKIKRCAELGGNCWLFVDEIVVE